MLQYFSEFGPDFTLQIHPSNRKDYNTEVYIKEVLEKIIGKLHQSFR